MINVGSSEDFFSSSDDSENDSKNTIKNSFGSPKRPKSPRPKLKDVSEILSGSMSDLHEQNHSVIPKNPRPKSPRPKIKDESEIISNTPENENINAAEYPKHENINKEK